MNNEIKKRIHAFRNALVLAADTRSHECFHMDRWRKELNAFPHGCCGLASNFLAQYLKDGDPTLTPEIVTMETTKAFRNKEIPSSIKAHMIVSLDDWYIDLTLNQFDEYDERVVIEKRSGILGTLIREIGQYGGKVTRQEDIQLDAGLDEDGSDLYAWLSTTANSLLDAAGPSATGGR